VGRLPSTEGDRSIEEVLQRVRRRDPYSAGDCRVGHRELLQRLAVLSGENPADVRGVMDKMKDFFSG